MASASTDKCTAHRAAGFDFHKGSFLSHAEWDRLQAWLAANPTMRLRKGEPVGRGLVFSDYRRRGRGGAYCCRKKVLDKALAHKRNLRDPKYAALHRFRAATRSDSLHRFNIWYRKCRNGAKKRGIDFVLTEEEARELYGHSCFYCGSAPAEDGSWGIDRMVNEIGYIFDNCVPCCGVCNQLKGQKNTLDFLAKVSDIATYRK